VKYTSCNFGIIDNLWQEIMQMIVQIDYQFLKMTKHGIKLQILNVQGCETNITSKKYKEIN
jgi:hypothetical protein